MNGRDAFLLKYFELLLPLTYIGGYIQCHGVEQELLFFTECIILCQQRMTESHQGAPCKKCSINHCPTILSIFALEVLLSVQFAHVNA